MKAAIYKGSGSIELGERPDPAIDETLGSLLTLSDVMSTGQHAAKRPVVKQRLSRDDLTREAIQ